MKLINRAIFYLTALILISSCASSKKFILLQDQQADAQNNQNELIKSFTLKEKEYLIKEDDRLLINIFSMTEERFNFLNDRPEVEVTVDSKGQIDLPVIGLVKISGLTIPNAEKKIKTAATDYLKNPRIAIKLLNFNYTVIGEVGKQGTINVIDPQVNVLEAIGQAGGFSEFADRQNVRLIRHENGKANIYQINVLEDNLLLSDKFFLQPNDVILVNSVSRRTTSRDRLSTVSIILSIVTSLSFVLLRVNN
ncbi:polysaccharide export protein, BexD/CtrA/VexA family [Adhaeribacter aerolatus]|uniref:Polysaccharide export protein, BexD/CtrA/VexA family n=1 Tax=Adhaeribacter aerolatus TaxID=670289 RepID=A0A512AW31_9BACT|nr:polysaccharide biosynthesis/export family protein [Adhaeribacter aerolatus]GEO03924.1 polysaccharide export protein, BexD/CtrA/VexA family [Adhaeribacter aerolatus]